MPEIDIVLGILGAASALYGFTIAYYAFARGLQAQEEATLWAAFQIPPGPGHKPLREVHTGVRKIAWRRVMLNMFLLGTTLSFYFSAWGNLAYLGNPTLDNLHQGLTGFVALTSGVVVWFVFVAVWNLGDTFENMPRKDESLLAAYFPQDWRDAQGKKSAVDQHWLYLVGFDPRFSTQRRNLVSRLAIMEKTLAGDLRSEAKRSDLAGKLRTPEEYPDMMAELEENYVLNKRASEVVYAPQFPAAGPDFYCALVRREVQVEVTALKGTADYRREDGLRDELEKFLYERPSGIAFDIGCDWMHYPDDRVVAYKEIKRWLDGRPGLGEHVLSTPRGELRLYVRKTDRDPAHTFLLGQMSSSSHSDIRDTQVVAKILSKMPQIIAGTPAAVALYVFPLLFGWEIAEILERSQHEIFESHPKLSAVVVVRGALGEPRRRVYRNKWGTSPLTDLETAALGSQS